jgi:hypothetical protein
MTDAYKKRILAYSRSIASNRTRRSRRGAGTTPQQGFEPGWLQIGPDAANWQAQGVTAQNAGRVKTILQVGRRRHCVFVGVGISRE